MAELGGLGIGAATLKAVNQPGDELPFAGGGLIIDGEIYRGCGRGAAEIGHLRINPRGNQYAPVILEELASGWAIGREARARGEPWTHEKSELYHLVCGQKERITAHHVGLAARQGDVFAQSVLQISLTYLAEAIGQVIALLCPRRIIIGGGVSLMGDVLFEPLRKMVRDRAFPPFAACYDIVPAALGEEVVVHGALALANKRLAAR